MNRIKQLRQEKGLNQDELGKILGVELAAISKYETERVQLTENNIKKLCEFFEVSTDYLLGLSDIRNGTENQYQILSNTLVAFADEIKEMDEYDKQMLLDFAKRINERNSKKEGK